MIIDLLRARSGPRLPAWRHWCTTLYRRPPTNRWLCGRKLFKLHHVLSSAYGADNRLLPDEHDEHRSREQSWQTTSAQLIKARQARALSSLTAQDVSWPSRRENMNKFTRSPDGSNIMPWKSGRTRAP